MKWQNVIAKLSALLAVLDAVLVALEKAAPDEHGPLKSSSQAATAELHAALQDASSSEENPENLRF